MLAPRRPPRKSRTRHLLQPGPRAALGRSWIWAAAKAALRSPAVPRAVRLAAIIARGNPGKPAAVRRTASAVDRVSPFSTPSATREVLERHGLYTKYGLGQNFLVNDDILRKILDLAEVGPDDHVLEVGPGIGTLTAALLMRANRVTAVEKDADLPAVLADTLAPWSERFTLLRKDL